MTLERFMDLTELMGREGSESLIKTCILDSILRGLKYLKNVQLFFSFI